MIIILLIPAIMVIAGYMMYSHPPKKINGFYGYRTRMAKKNKDTWETAHDLCGRIWMRDGLVMLGLSLILLVVFINAARGETLGAIITILEIAVMLYGTYETEQELKTIFREDGSRKEKKA